MSETVTLELPDTLAQSARAVAQQTHRRFEDVLIAWLRHAASDVPVEQLNDDEVLALRDLQMSAEQQTELSGLLAAQREGRIQPAERQKLDDLLAVYRSGMVRKARALQVAVERGLQPPVAA